MTEPKSSGPEELRRAAEARLRVRAGAAAAPEGADLHRLLHELQVHQIELEIQNEELIRTRDAAEEALERATELYDFAPVGYLTLDREGLIRDANFAAASLLGRERLTLAGVRLATLVTPAARAALPALLAQSFAAESKVVCSLPFVGEGPLLRYAHLEAVASASGLECRLAIIDVTAAKTAEAEREKLIAELQSSRAEVKTLTGLLPICASCKKIRDEVGEWKPVEVYIQSRSEAHFSHGICPDCTRRLYPEAWQRMQERKTGPL